MNLLKHLAITLFLLSPLHLLAQLEKGNTTLGGEAGLNVYFEDDFNLTSISFLPSKTWMLSKNIELGGQAGLSFLAIDEATGGFYTIAPEVNFYFNPDSPGLKFFGSIKMGIVGPLGDFAEDGVDPIYFFGFGIGALSFLNQNVAFQPRIDYLYQDNNGFDASSVQLSASLKAFLGNPSGDDTESFGSIPIGSFLIGGTQGAINFQFDEGNNTTTVFLNPQALYLFSDNVAIGAKLGIGSRNGDRFTSDLFVFSLVPQARYYFSPLTESGATKFFGTLAAGLEFIDSNGFDDTRGQLELGIGANIFVAPNVAIEGVLAFQRSGNTLSFLNDPLFNIFPIENRIGANFTIQYFWNR